VTLSTSSAYQYAQGIGFYGGHPVASFGTSENTRYSASPDAGATFGAPRPIPAPGGSSTILRSGPGGLFAMWDTLGHTSKGQYDVAKYGPSGFGKPYPVEGSERSNHDQDLYEDGGGRLHVAFDVLHPSGAPVSLRYTASRDGRHWSTPLDAVRGTKIAGSNTFSVGARAPGQGFVVYGTSVNPTGTVFAAPLPKAVCHVPKLKGKSLSQAKSALLAAHCRLGKVHKPKGKKAKVVTAQNPHAGKTIADKGAVNVALGPK
jgi:hypothetical protein